MINMDVVAWARWVLAFLYFSVLSLCQLITGGNYKKKLADENLVEASVSGNG